jgi:hypothetical protein
MEGYKEKEKKPTPPLLLTPSGTYTFFTLTFAFKKHIWTGAALKIIVLKNKKFFHLMNSIG